MNKYIITGFSGFVSRYYLRQLESKREPVLVLGIDLNEPDLFNEEFHFVKWHFNKIDLIDFVTLQETINNFQPDYILHLAAFSSVAYSWTNPVASFRNNTNIFLNLLEIVRKNQLKCRILSVGSSEEYGFFDIGDLPLMETHPLNPISPYAVARVSQELLSKVYIDGYGLDIILTRSFNHFGPGQKDVFVIPSIAKKLVQLKKQANLGSIITGDISVIRDFLDVRDVVVAYDLLFQKGHKGEIYNICSGEGISISEIIKKLERILEIKADIIQDPKLVRPNDIKAIIGNNLKLIEHTGWKRKYEIDSSLSDIVKWFINNVD